MKTLMTIGAVEVRQNDDGSLEWTAGMTIDADGAYRAYHPDNNSGLDDLRNAQDGRGGWCGIVLDPSGKPAIQGAEDPAPGFYVSPTAYQFPEYIATDPRRYVDSESVPYIVVPPQIRLGVPGIVLGCHAELVHERTGEKVDAAVCDIGPRRHIGEASIASAKALGIPSSARTGGEERRIITYRIWPGVPAIVNGTRYPLQRA